MSTVHYAAGDEPIPGSGYRLVSFLGRGGFGEVWKATAPGGTEVALKVIRFGSREGRKEFRALQLVKRIRHPNLVPIIGFWLKSQEGEILDDEAVRQAETGPAAPALPTETMAVPLSLTSSSDEAAELIMAMGLGDQSLMDRFEKCRQEGLPGIPDQELLAYLDDSAEALDFLNSPVHDLGSGPVAIQHCDIKPHNLMIVGGSAQVCDFGLARIMGSDRATTAAASLAYAAPETLIEGKPSGATDQYSLAVTFFEMKTGKLPYLDLTLAAVVDAKRNEKLDFSDLPEATQAVLRRATSNDPGKRYASCREMVEMLRRSLAEPGSAADRAAKKGSRRTLLVAAAAGVIAVALWLGWRGLPVGWETIQGGGGAARTPSTLPPANVPAPTPAGVVQPEKARPPEVPALATLEQAEAHFRQGQLSAAIEDYNRLIGQQPRDGRPLLGRARCYLQQKLVAQAIADLEAARQLDPPAEIGPQEQVQFAEAYLDRSKPALDKRDFAAAVADLQRASQLAPRDVRAFSRLGVAWAGQGQWQKAADSLTAALEIKPYDGDYLARGRAYRELKQLDKAIADYNEAVRLNPQNALAYSALGSAYMDKDDLPHSVAAYGEAIKLWTGDPAANSRLVNARLLRANVWLQEGKKNDEAAADVAEVVKLLRPDDRNSASELLDALDALVTAYADDHQFAKAAQWAQKAIELAPDESTRSAYRERLKKYQAAGANP